MLKNAKSHQKKENTEKLFTRYLVQSSKQEQGRSEIREVALSFWSTDSGDPPKTDTDKKLS